MTKSSALFCCALFAASGLSAFAQTPPKLVPLDSTGLITYYIADGIPTFGNRPGDIELATLAFKEWERAADGEITLKPITDESTALIRLYWQHWAKAEYGQTKPTIANRRLVYFVYIRPNTLTMHKTMGPAAAKDPLLRDTILYLSTLHEIGHALGIAHSPNSNDVMYTNGSFGNFVRYRKRLTTRTDIATLSWLSDNDKAQLKGLYKK